jgi:hypothetical protein
MEERKPVAKPRKGKKRLLENVDKLDLVNECEKKIPVYKEILQMIREGKSEAQILAIPRYTLPYRRHANVFRGQYVIAANRKMAAIAIDSGEGDQTARLSDELDKLHVHDEMYKSTRDGNGIEIVFRGSSHVDFYCRNCQDLMEISVRKHTKDVSVFQQQVDYQFFLLCPCNKRRTLWRTQTVFKLKPVPEAKEPNEKADENLD